MEALPLVAEALPLVGEALPSVAEALPIFFKTKSTPTPTNKKWVGFASS